MAKRSFLKKKEAPPSRRLLSLTQKVLLGGGCIHQKNPAHPRGRGRPSAASLIYVACDCELLATQSAHILRCSHQVKSHDFAVQHTFKSTVQFWLGPFRKAIFKTVRLHLCRPSSLLAVTHFCIPNALDKTCEIFDLGEPVSLKSIKNLSFRVRFCRFAFQVLNTDRGQM